jgi:hypothetical protein
VLIAGDLLCGWALRQPARHLAQVWRPPVGGSDDRLAGLLSRYYALVEAEGLERMEDQDPQVLRDLLALRAEMAAVDLPAAALLSDSLRTVIDSFYETGQPR